MTGPRNKAAFQRGHRHREAIRGLLASRPQTMPTLTAEQIRERLGLPISVRMVQEHVHAIQAAELDRATRNLSNTSSSVRLPRTTSEI